MITLLKGVLEEVWTESIVVMAGDSGVGYEVAIPKSVFPQLPSIGSDVRLYTYMQVREDAVQLYGFLHKQDLQFFRMLIGVSGIGPKGALGILSTLTPDALRMAILSGDAKSIAKSPGVGLKTAQKLVLELGDKISLQDIGVAEDFSGGQAVSVLPQTKLSQVRQNAIEALVALGYGEGAALGAVNQIPVQESEDENRLLKEALKYLF